MFLRANSISRTKLNSNMQLEILSTFETFHDKTVYGNNKDGDEPMQSDQCRSSSLHR